MNSALCARRTLSSFIKPQPKTPSPRQAVRLSGLDPRLSVVDAPLLVISCTVETLLGHRHGKRALALAHARLPVQKHLLAREELIDTLQGQIARLGVEEPDEGQEAGVEDCKVDVRLPLQVLDGDWGDFDDEEGEDPVRGRGERGGLLARGKGRVLGRQEPGDGQHANSEEEVEEEEHNYGHDAVRFLACRDCASEHGHADGLPRARKHHERAPAEAVEQPDGWKRGEKVGDAVEAGEQAGCVWRYPNTDLEDEGCVVPARSQ